MFNTILFYRLVIYIYTYILLFNIYVTKLFCFSLMMTNVETGRINIFLTPNLNIYLMNYNVYHSWYLRVYESFRNIKKLSLKCVVHLKYAVEFNIYVYIMMLYILFIYIIIDFSINGLTTCG